MEQTVRFPVAFLVAVLAIISNGPLACEKEGGAGGTSGPAESRPPGHAPGTHVEGLPPVEKGSAQLDGLFMTVRFAGGSIQQFYHFFTPAGYVYADVPPGGLEHFDFAKAAKDAPGVTGTYTINGDKLTIKFADGTSRETEYGMDESKKVRLDGLYAHKAEPFKAGTTFDGTYGGGAAAGGGGTFAASSATYTFKPDGTYQASRLGGVSARAAGTDAGAKSESNEAGTYNVTGNTLELKQADGRIKRHTIFPYKIDETTRLNINGTMYKP